MAATKQRHSNRSEFDLYGDLAKIKSALADATYDVKGRAGEILSQSFEDMRERSNALQENVGNLVADKPLKSVGIALLAGMAIGYFIHR